MAKVVGIAIAAGVMIAAGIVAFEKAEARSDARAAALAALPLGYEFRGAMRSVGLALTPSTAMNPDIPYIWMAMAMGSPVSVADDYQQRNVALQRFNPKTCRKAYRLL
ncbi:hypothetical protein NRB_34110 [Novosphingobium sp. 11B]